MTPAKRHPFSVPKPKEPRTAQVMPPSAAKNSIGKTRSCTKSSRLFFIGNSKKGAVLLALADG
jgi:hypothetical protein